MLKKIVPLVLLLTAGVASAQVMQFHSKYGASLVLNSTTHEAVFSNPCPAVSLKNPPHFEAPYTLRNGHLTLHGKTTLLSFKPPYTSVPSPLFVHFVKMPDGAFKEIAPFPTAAQDLIFHGSSCALGLSDPDAPVILFPVR